MSDPDVSPDPAARWWSDMPEEELRAELAELLDREPDELAEVGVEEPHGAAWALTTDGRRYRFAGDGRITSFEIVGRGGSRR